MDILRTMIRFGAAALLLYISAFIGPLAVFTIMAALVFLVWDM